MSTTNSRPSLGTQSQDETKQSTNSLSTPTRLNDGKRWEVKSLTPSMQSQRGRIYKTTTEYMGHGISWNPQSPYLVATTSGACFGMAGQGEMSVYSYRGGEFKQIRSVKTKEACLDCSWHPRNGSIVAFASGDGLVYLHQSKEDRALGVLSGHRQEIYAVDWNQREPSRLLSGSWDKTVKVWDVEQMCAGPSTLGSSSRSGSGGSTRSNSSRDGSSGSTTTTTTRLNALSTWRGHTDCVDAVMWRPQHTDEFLSCGADGTVRLWDANCKHAVAIVRASSSEVMTAAWNPMDPHQFATGGVDKTVAVWDARVTRAPVLSLAGHELAIRQVRFSPHQRGLLASGGYDMSVRVWDVASSEPLLAEYDHHTEFVIGLDWSPHTAFVLMTSSWDCTLSCFSVPQSMRIPKKG